MASKMKTTPIYLTAIHLVGVWAKYGFRCGPAIRHYQENLSHKYVCRAPYKASRGSCSEAFLNGGFTGLLKNCMRAWGYDEK